MFIYSTDSYLGQSVKAAAYSRASLREPAIKPGGITRLVLLIGLAFGLTMAHQSLLALIRSLFW